MITMLPAATMSPQHVAIWLAAGIQLLRMRTFHVGYIGARQCGKRDAEQQETVRVCVPCSFRGQVVAVSVKHLPLVKLMRFFAQVTFKRRCGGEDCRKGPALEAWHPRGRGSVQT